ncbi:MAG: hypothetical protein IJ744_10425 [Lachnospiraceae bacterium]|nr:hypothetical protein [Lachnospiraceae bacterium]
MKHTKLLSLCVLMTVCLMLAGCNGKTVSSDTQSETQTDAEGKTSKTDTETEKDSKTDANVAKQQEASKPKLCAEITLKSGSITSWITYRYEGDLLVEKNDPYQGIATEYSYDEDGKTVVTRDCDGYGNVTEESRYNSQEKLIYIKSNDSKYISLKDDQGNEVYHYVKNGGAEHELIYDEQGRISQIIYHNAANPGYFSFEYSSDGLHLDIVANDNNGTSTLYEEIDYDDAGHIVKETDSFVTTWTYDDQGRLIGEERYQGGLFNFRYTWEYDEKGHNSRRIDEFPDYTTTHFYLRDESGNIIQTYQEQEDPTDNEIIYTILESSNVYNNRGALEKHYTYSSYAESWDDWNAVILYFYEGDQIPKNIGQLNP